MRALDTAYNYADFQSHRILREVAGDLLKDFEVSTKVGFFRDRHDHDPARIRGAIEESTEHLGRRPDTVLLHNPENSPADFRAACEMLAELRDADAFGRWGISSWDPRLLMYRPYLGPRPDVLMVRAGLTCPWPILEAADAFSETVRPRERWGMAPFGHSTRDPIWTAVDASVFLPADRRSSAVEAALAAAFSLPAVSRIAVGTTHRDHLAQLQRYRMTKADEAVIWRYRDLLRKKASFGTVHLRQPLPGARA